MNWKKTFFKPKWQHKDPEIRAMAVAEGQEPELIEALETIAVADESIEVRAAAARRLQRPGKVIEALQREPEASVRAVLSARLRSLLTQPDTAGSSLEERVTTLNQSDSRELWEAVARDAPEVELRRAALEKIEKPGFLGDRAIDDPDPGLRRLAASRIQQESTLKRVIDATRTKDKLLHQELTQRLHEEQLAAGHPEAIHEEARRICELLEAQLIRGDRHDEERVKALEMRWAALGDAIPPALQQRFGSDLERLRQPPPVPKEESPAPAAVENEPPAAVPPSEPAAPVEADTAIDPRLNEAITELDDRLKKQTPPTSKQVEHLADRLNTLFASIPAPGEAELELHDSAQGLLTQLRQKAIEAEEEINRMLTSAQDQLSSMQQALDDGELHKALELRTKLQEAGAQLSGHRDWKLIQSKLSAALGRLRELRDWQHWANDKIRKRLIADMEALPAAGLHPDAVLERIKELQSEWKSLEASEQIPGDRHYAAAPWMWRRFNAAGRQAFDLTKPYLDKRSEVQGKQLETFESQASLLLDQAEAKEVDWKALNESMNRVRKALRSLSTIPAKQRKKTAALLKRALEAGKSVKQAHFDQIEKQKLKLIREAAQLQHVDDHEEALALAKSLQAQWKSAGSLWRSRENELWKQFREPIDPLFAALDEQRDRARAEHEERRARQKSLCIELENLLESKNEDLNSQQGRVQGLSDEWSEIQQPERRLRERFERALEQFHRAVEVQERQAVAEARARWWAKAETLHELEGAVSTGKLSAAKRKKLEQNWPKSESAGEELDRLLDQRFESALASSADPSELIDGDLEAARRICIGLEFLAGLPGPDEEKEQRMEYQVRRLSDAMTGERERVPALEEARALEREWLLLGYIPDDKHAELHQRAHLALSKFLEE